MAKIKTKVDAQAALTAARNQRRQQAAVDVQILAAKLAGGAELTADELRRIDAAVADGVDADEFGRAVDALSRVPNLERRVSDFDFEGTARTIRTLEADLTRMIQGHRTEELEAANLVADARLRALSADTAREKLDATKRKYPHAFTSS